MIEGKLIESSDINRGKMIVYSEEEWMDRIRSRYREFIKPMLILGIIFIAIAFVLAFGTLYRYNQINYPKISYLIFIPDFILACILFCIPGPLLYFVGMWKAMHEPTLGLYENGIQFYNDIFVPYKELEKIERRIARRNLRKRELIVLIQKHERSGWPYPYHSMKWPIREDFLGDEGMIVLNRRIDSK